MINNNSLATSKIYGHDELHIPKSIKKEYTHTPLEKGTIIDWEIRDNEIILRPRKKVKVEDIIGIVKADTETDSVKLKKEIYKY